MDFINVIKDQMDKKDIDLLPSLENMLDKAYDLGVEHSLRVIL